MLVFCAIRSGSKTIETNKIALMKHAHKCEKNLLTIYKNPNENMHTNVKKTHLQFTRIQMKTCTQM